MDICKLSIKISRTTERSHVLHTLELRETEMKWPAHLLSINPQSRIVDSLFAPSLGRSLVKTHSPLPLSLSMGIYSRLTFSLSLRVTGPLEADCSCRSLVLCFLYALRKGALVCRSVPGPLSLAWLRCPLPSRVGRWARGRARLGEGDRLYCDHIQNTRTPPYWPGRSPTLFSLKMPMICGVNDLSEEPVTRKKPQGGKQTWAWLFISQWHKSLWNKNGQILFFYIFLQNTAIFIISYLSVHIII